MILLYISLVNMGADIHPFKSLIDVNTGLISLKYENYFSIFRNEDGTGFLNTIYADAFIKSISYAFITAFFCLIIGFPFAYFISCKPPHIRSLLLTLVMLPFWISFLLRVYAWKGILADQGVLNQLFLWLRVINEPIQLLYTDFSMLLGMIYVYLPFMVLPLYSNLCKLDFRFIEAAYDLGASPFKAFWLITIPLSMAGIISGFMLVFIPALGEFVIPSLLGGAENVMIGRVVWDEMFASNNWPRACALAITMVALMIFPIAIYYSYSGISSDSSKVA